MGNLFKTQSGSVTSRASGRNNILKKFFDNFEKNRTILWLKRYLESLEVLLTSFSKAFPKIEAILEFLGFLKNTLKVRENKTKNIHINS